MATIVRCNKDHPYRLTNWRWERARFLRENNNRALSKSNEDSVVIEAHKFQTGLFKCRDEVDHCLLAEKYPDIYYAYDIWDQDELEIGTTNPARFEIEARILACQPLAEIADRVCAPLNAIIYYEKLFFNVTDRIEKPGYILHQVIGPSVHKGLSDRHYDVLWKLYGYFYGPVVLDSLITTCQSPSKLQDPKQLDEFFANDARSSIRRKSAVAARTMPINSYTQIPIIELHAKMLELETDKGEDQSHNLIMANIGEMMNIFKTNKIITVGDDPVRIDANKDCASELRADEILAVGSGKEIPNLEEIRSLTIPVDSQGAKNEAAK